MSSNITSFKKGKKTSTNTYEFDQYYRQPDERTGWKMVQDWIYNPRKGTVFGHTKKRWGIVGLFYLVFYSILALLCAICYCGLMASIDLHRPTYTLRDSIIGINPGLGFRPMPHDPEQRSLLWYASDNSTAIREYVDSLDTFLEKYHNKSLLPFEGRTQMICDYQRPPEPNKVCAVDINDWGPCSRTNSYGFNNSSPCIFIKLNRIYDWQPEFYNNASELPEDMPEDLKEHIKKAPKEQLNTIWVSCAGEKQVDKEHIGEIEYYPKSRGFPGYYYPYVNDDEYLSPLVAVHFKRPKNDEIIYIECRAWAKNIKYESKRNEKIGAVHFELQIDNKA
ncbi:unnamed protein product [Trichogramma brassicae]|uniref:Sodium/potassium-transporting ATPase subunit beta n=1 Tax=Trichogramma brassicae TaxID=86971 RepID=A0A6H5ID80_9HYME|nr:unnamed protein product [Trichogramma brassicae]